KRKTGRTSTTIIAATSPPPTPSSSGRSELYCAGARRGLPGGRAALVVDLGALLPLQFRVFQNQQKDSRDETPPPYTWRRAGHARHRRRACPRRRQPGRREKEECHVRGMSRHPGFPHRLSGSLFGSQAGRPERGLHRERAQGLQGRRSHPPVDEQHRREPDRAGHGGSRRLLRAERKVNPARVFEDRSKMKKIWISLAAIALAWAAGSAWAGADLAAAEKKVNELCGTCHGKDGNTPNTPDTPKLAGQPADYLSKALHAYKSGKRKNPIMGGMAGT